jgi:hypothetical protein
LVGACFGGWVAAEWITGGLAHMREHGLERIEATPDAVDRWVQHVNDAANAALLPQARHSWYLGANVPGKPRVCSCLMPAGWRAIARSAPANRNGYEGFALSV